MKRLLGLVAALAVTGACSPVPPPTGPPAAVVPTAGPDSPSPSATSTAVGTLVVQQSRIDGGFYIEGAYAYVEVTDESGRQVTRVEDPDYHLDKEIARVELPVGSYVITTYVRPCAAACPALDESTDACSLTVEVAEERLVEVQLRRRVGRPCEASIVDS